MGRCKIPLVVLLCLLMNLQGRLLAQEMMDADGQAVLDHVHGIFRAYMREDVDTIRATHSDDWVGFLSESTSILRGIDAYMEGGESFLRSFRLLDYTLTDTEVQVSADVALLYYTTNVTVLDRATGKRESLSFRSLDVFRRNAEGWVQSGSHFGTIPSQADSLSGN